MAIEVNSVTEKSIALSTLYHAVFFAIVLVFDMLAPVCIPNPFYVLANPDGAANPDN